VKQTNMTQLMTEMASSVTFINVNKKWLKMNK